MNFILLFKLQKSPKSVRLKLFTELTIIIIIINLIYPPITLYQLSINWISYLAISLQSYFLLNFKYVNIERH